MLVEILFQWLQLHFSEHRDGNERSVLHTPTHGHLMYLFLWTLKSLQATWQLGMTKNLSAALRQQRCSPQQYSSQQHAKFYRWDCTYAGFLQPATGLQKNWMSEQSHSMFLLVLFTATDIAKPSPAYIILSSRGTSVQYSLALKQNNNHHHQHEHVIGNEDNNSNKIILRFCFPVHCTDKY